MTPTEQLERSLENADKLELKFRLEYVLDRAAHERNEKKRFEFWLEKAREYSRRLREHKGESKWVIVGFAFTLSLLVASAVYKLQPTSYIYNAPHTTWRVLQQFNDYDFRMQRVEEGKAMAPVVMYYCHDFKTGWEPGMTLTQLWMDYDNINKCWSVAHANRGFSILRDSTPDTCPVVPANCHHLNCADKPHDHVLCDGLPKFD
jgi:hypothetical protein